VPDLHTIKDAAVKIGVHEKSLKCGGEHYLKEELEAMLPHQSLCYDHHRKI